MYSCAFFGIGDCVVDGDLDCIAPIGLDRRLHNMSGTSSGLNGKDSRLGIVR